MEKSWNTEKFLIILATLFGASILFFPIQNILGGLIILILLFFLLFNPKLTFYIMIFTIPFVERIRILPISFSINDIFVLLCLFAAIIDFFFKERRVNLKTKLDIWNLVLLILFFTSGFTSVGTNGVLGAFKFFEAIVIFYLTVYFIRTKQITISKIIKIIVFTALFQSVIGIFQSLTGIGTLYRQPRGFLGYLGIGSTMVWQGVGTMGHFNSFGVFVLTVLLFSFPIIKDIVVSKRKRNFLLLILFYGTIFSYSRNCLIGLYFCSIYYIFIKIKNKILFSAITTISLSVIYAVKTYLSQTAYVNTISPRTDIWNAVIASILSKPRYLWFGAGLNSYEQTVYPFLPQNNTLWFAHNFYLLTAQEMGIVGFSIFFLFLLFVLIDTFRKTMKLRNKLAKNIAFGTSICIFSIFCISVFDHAYSLPYFKILLFTILGLIYSRKPKNLNYN